MRGSPSGPQRATFDTTRDSCRSSWRRAQALRSRTRRTREPSRLHHGHRHAERTRPTRSVRPNFLALSKGAERVASARGRVVFAGGCVLTILYLDIDGEGVMVRCWLVRCPDQASPGIGSALLARDHARAGRRRRPRLSQRVCRARCAPRSLACRRGVLPADLSDLRDAVTAAALRQDAVRRQDGTSSAGRSRCSLEPRQRERPLVGFSPANAGAAASGLSRERKGGGSLMVALSGLAPAFRSILFAWEGRPNR